MGLPTLKTSKTWIGGYPPKSWKRPSEQSDGGFDERTQRRPFFGSRSVWWAALVQIPSFGQIGAISRGLYLIPHAPFISALTRERKINPFGVLCDVHSVLAVHLGD